MLNTRHDDGFTLIELVLSIAILALVMSAVAASFMVAMNVAPQSDSRLNNSRDTLVMSAYFAGDVQGAVSMVVPNPSNPPPTPKCTTGVAGDVLVIGLEGKDFTPALVDETVIVDYVVRTIITQGGTTNKTFHRLACLTTAPTPTYPLTASSDVALSLYLSATTAPVVVCFTSAGVSAPCADATAVKATATIYNSNTNTMPSFTVTGSRRTITGSPSPSPSPT